MTVIKWNRWRLSAGEAGLSRSWCFAEQVHSPALTQALTPETVGVPPSWRTRVGSWRWWWEHQGWQGPQWEWSQQGCAVFGLSVWMEIPAQRGKASGKFPVQLQYYEAKLHFVHHFESAISKGVFKGKKVVVRSSSVEFHWPPSFSWICTTFLKSKVLVSSFILPVIIFAMANTFHNTFPNI